MDDPSSDAERPAELPTAAVAAQIVSAVERCAAGVRHAAVAIVSRRGLPLAVVGAFIVALAWVGERDTAWGFPMLIAGALMLGLGLLGPRLSGSVAMRWGDDGTFIEISSTIAPPGQRRSAPTLSEPAPDDRDDQAVPERLMPPSEIEGDAETIDFKIEATGASLDSDPEETGS